MGFREGKNLLILFVFLIPLLVFAEPVANYPGWQINPANTEDPENSSSFILSHQDGRSPISIHNNVAEQIKSGAVSPEWIYLSYTKKYQTKDGQFLGNSGLVAPNDPIYSTATKEDQPAGYKSQGASFPNSGSNASSGYRDPASLHMANPNSPQGMGLGAVGGTSQPAQLGGAGGSSGVAGSGSSTTASTGADSAHAVDVSNGKKNAGSGGGGMNSVADKTAQAYYQQYYGTGNFIPFDTNSGQYDPNIKAGAEAGTAEVLQRAGKYAK